MQNMLWGMSEAKPLAWGKGWRVKICKSRERENLRLLPVLCRLSVSEAVPGMPS